MRSRPVVAAGSNHIDPNDAALCFKKKVVQRPPTALPFSGVVDGLRLTEKHEPHESPTPHPNLGDYTITIEREILSSDELHHWTHSIGAVVDELDKVWPYVCGEPFNPIATRISFDTTPVGWESNRATVVRELAQQCRGIIAIAKLGPREWSLAGATLFSTRKSTADQTKVPIR